VENSAEGRDREARAHVGVGEALEEGWSSPAASRSGGARWWRGRGHGCGWAARLSEEARHWHGRGAGTAGEDEGGRCGAAPAAGEVTASRRPARQGGGGGFVEQMKKKENKTVRFYEGEIRSIRKHRTRW
jgi:hypothetical protein